MDGRFDRAGTASNREDIYRLLARLYRAEIDKALLEGLKRLSFPAQDAPGAWGEGTALLNGWLTGDASPDLHELAADYARVFLGAGVSDGRAAFPYESVYTSPERLIMQRARDEALACYREKGLAKSAGLVEPEDHVAFELEFMALLCTEGRTAAEAGADRAAAASLAEQHAFLHGHLLNWVPAFCADVELYARSKLYRAVAKMTRGYLGLDCALLDRLMGVAAEPEGDEPRGGRQRTGAPC